MNLPLSIDFEIGEVFGPDYFGAWSSPGPPMKTQKMILDSIPDDIKLLDDRSIFGKHPVWPESFEEGRLRMAARVEEYAARATHLSGMGFILVTHGDCIATCVSLALAGVRGLSIGPTIKKVNYCAYVLLERCYSAGEESVGLMDTEAAWTVSYDNIVIDKTQGGFDSAEEAMMMQEDAAYLAEKRENRRQEKEMEAASAEQDASALPKVVRKGRRNTTKVLLAKLGKDESTEIVGATSLAEPRLNEMLPNFPAGKKLSEPDVEGLSMYAGDAEAGQSELEGPGLTVGHTSTTGDAVTPMATIHEDEADENEAS